MANLNTVANFTLRGFFSLKAGVGNNLSPQSCPIFGQTKFKVSGTPGPGVASKGHFVALLATHNTTTAFDMANLTDLLGATGVVWADIKVIVVQHDPASLASSVKITGAVANSIPGLRTSDLKPGQAAVPFIDLTGAGLTFTSPNSQIIVTNNDAAIDATVNIWIEGE